MKLLFDQYNYIVTEDEFLNDEEISKVESLIWGVPETTSVLQMDHNMKNFIAADLTQHRPVTREIVVSDESKWLYEKIYHLVRSANMHFFHMILKGGENLQHRTFNDSGSSIEVDRDWSNDYFTKKVRFHIQLTDEDHYEGGDLLIYERSIETPFKAPRKKGSVTIFATCLFLHEITPVTSGSASSITGCIYGPPLE